MVEGYTYGAGAYMEKDQPQRAEALALQATKMFPDNIGGPLEYARIAVITKNWEEALRRWQPVRDQFDYFGAYIGAAQALTHLCRYDEAEALLQQARLRFGTEPGPLCEFARVAEAKGDIPAAIQRWKDVLLRFPLDMHVYLSASEAFEKLGESAEADATLRAAIERFPTESQPMHELAKLLHLKRRDFPAAAEVWGDLRRAFPDTEEAYSRGVEALRLAGNAEAADALLEEQKLRFSPTAPG